VTDRWARYLLDYHDANPGITEDVLADARDDAGRSPYDWLVEAVPPGASTIVDVGCGSGPLAHLLAAGRVVGVDRSAGELARASGLLVRAEAAALPIAGGSADVVVSSLALMLLRPLEAVLDEVRRLLGPGGTFVATLPVRAASPGPTATPAFTEILRALGQAGTDYPEPLNDATLADRFRASGLGLDGDATALFSRTVRGPADAACVVRSFYAPGAGPDRVAAAIDELQRRVTVAPVEIAYRIRRLVAQRV